MYVDAKLPEVSRILQATFPRNGFREVSVSAFRGPKNVNSYWDGGSRSEFALFDMVSGQSFSVPESHPFYNRNVDGDRLGAVELRELPPNTVLVEAGTMQGKPRRPHIFARDDSFAKRLAPPAIELEPKEASALRTIQNYRGGYRTEEFHRAGLGEYGPANEWIIRLRCRELVKVNKAGAVSVTLKGRNWEG